MLVTMTMKKAKDADYFGTYLDTVKVEPPPSSVPASPPSSDVPTLRDLLPLLLARESVSIPELAADLGKSLMATAAAVDKLQASGLVAVTGPAGSEQVALTEAGRVAAELA
jgi:hypothetical protein